MSGKDYYEVLGIPRDADQKAIRDAFRNLALHHHPDRDKSPGAEERFKEIAEAYAVLSDPGKRSEYDSKGFISGFSPEDLFGGIDFGDLFGGDIFERFFRPPRQDLQVELRVPIEKIASGGEERVFLKRPDVCPVCRGSGAEKTEPCKACGGSGRISEKKGQGNVLIQEITTCPVCHGKGAVVIKPCDACQGRGRLEHEETLVVTIPKGIEEGAALRLQGKGGRQGGPPGDLYVVVRSMPDKRFERSGADLWHVETIQVADAVLGTELTVDTLYGKAKVTVPPGSQPESVLRLRDKGLPRFGRTGNGDFYLKLKVLLPEHLSREEHVLYEKLREMTHGS